MCLACSVTCTPLSTPCLCPSPGGTGEKDRAPISHESFLLMASSQTDMDDWVKAIRRVIWAPFGGGKFKLQPKTHGKYMVYVGKMKTNILQNHRDVKKTPMLIKSEDGPPKVGKMLISCRLHRLQKSTKCIWNKILMFKMEMPTSYLTFSLSVSS